MGAAAAPQRRVRWQRQRDTTLATREVGEWYARVQFTITGPGQRGGAGPRREYSRWLDSAGRASRVQAVGTDLSGSDGRPE